MNIEVAEMEENFMANMIALLKGCQISMSVYVLKLSLVLFPDASDNFLIWGSIRNVTCHSDLPPNKQPRYGSSFSTKLLSQYGHLFAPAVPRFTDGQLSAFHRDRAHEMLLGIMRLRTGLSFESYETYF
jgi:hypothetical protein